MAQGRTLRTPKKDEKLLRKLELGYSVSAACKAEGISRSTYYKRRDEDATFREATDDAIETGTDLLEDIARKRAIDPQNGSDTLVIFLLKGRRPEKYRERSSVDHSGSIDLPLAVTMIRDHVPAGAEDPS